jgi:4-amino-4-deoxy-L-arabinose transferase-like glycosyltransferase
MTASETTIPMPPATDRSTSHSADGGALVAPSGALSRLGDAARDRIALGSVMGLAAVLYLWNLTVSGYANTYYAMAAQAASRDWGAFLFGSLDAANFITLDKPPASTWLMGLSVRLLGLSSWSILLPQALLGIATVGALFLAVRRSFGRESAIVAAAVMALTPAATLIFRYNNPDALLTFVLVMGAWALGRGLEGGRMRWPILAASLVGLAFLTKYLQAYVVLPAFGLVWLVAAPGSSRRRIAGLLASLATVVVTSGWWVAIVELLPASTRPYIGGSTNNSALDLILGYDGLGRIFGQGIGGGHGAPGVAFNGGAPGGSPTGGGLPTGGPGAGVGFGGEPGLLRMLNAQFGGEIGWLIPLAFLCLVVGLALHRGGGRRNPILAGYLLWGTWLVVGVLVLSLMSGIVHPYYSVMLAPAIGALVGAGIVELWRRRERYLVAGLLLAAAFAGSTAWALVILDRAPAFAPGLGIGALALALASGLVLLLPADAVDRRIAWVALAIGAVAILIGPAAYSAATTSRALAGGDPAAGPASGNGFAPGGFGAEADAAVVTYLQANRGSERWIVATQGSGNAASIQLATGEPVLTMGGFSGSDAAPTAVQLKELVAAGELRFVLVGGRDGPPGRGGSNATTWVTGACTAVDLGSTAGSTEAAGAAIGPGGATTLYDCAGAG